MNKHQEDIWLSIYLFYNEPWEDFLQKAIEPYVSTAIQTGIAEQYFFIRYWEKGPHIRLRLKGNTEMVNTILKPNLEEHFLNYFESKPSRRIEPQYPAEFSEKLKWFPNNSIQYVDYVPEFDRFGGINGVACAEEQFMISSRTVLEFIKQKGRNWSYDDAMGTAIKLHLSFIHSAGFSIEEAISFFDFFTKNWLTYTFKNVQEEITKEDYSHQSDLSIKAFEDSFDAQKESLIPFHEALWIGMEEGTEFEETILNYWTKKNKSILNSLIYLFQNQKLSNRSDQFVYQIAPQPYSDKSLIYSILADFVHLTNNRLGIFNRDESYLSFMMKRCLEEIKKNDQVSLVIPNSNSN